ncbi:unnamed protein product [Pylaiella littoralis]
MSVLQEGGAMPVLPQRCNMCWTDANGSCFRTQCNHLFCESCAFQHFGQSQACPSCGVSLEEANIFEVTLGLAPGQFDKMMFQEIYKEPDYRSMGHTVVQTAMALHESVAFVMAQMTLEGQRAAESDVQLKADLAKQRHETGRITMQVRNQIASFEQKLREAEHKLRLREKEIVDIQEAYKEKSRKCQAWEKAYGNLRSQMDRGGRVGEFTTPESPRAGAMRAPSGSFVGSGGHSASMQQQVSPRESAGSGSGGGGTMQRPADPTRTNSPHSSSRAGTFMGRGGGGGGSRSSWPMPRPTTSRGSGGGGGGGRSGSVGDHISPMLRPRQGQGFSSHAVTPSPTFPAQQGTTGRFTGKRPETPMEVRGYYSSSNNVSPSSRSGGTRRSGGGSVAGGGGGRSGAFFPSTKSGLF